MIFLLGCDDNNPVNGGVPPENLVMQFTYTDLGDVIELVSDSTYCNGTEVETVYITDYAPYELDGDNLYLTGYDTLSQGGIIRTDNNYTRMDESEGLSGIWEQTEYEVTVVSGNLTQDEQDKLTDEMAMINAMIEDGSIQLEISADTAKLYYMGSIASVMLKLMNAQLETMENFDYLDITLKASGSEKIQIVGNVSGEIVTITIDENFNQTYSSTNPSHETYKVYEKIVECPVDNPPNWFMEFIFDNISYSDVLIKYLEEMPFFDTLDVTIEKIDNSSLSITGNKSGEIVTISKVGDETIRFESTDPTHLSFETNKL